MKGQITIEGKKEVLEGEFRGNFFNVKARRKVKS